MRNIKTMNTDLLQLCISRGVIPLPSIYLVFLNALRDLERKHLVCLLPIARFEVFHFTFNPEKLSRKKKPDPVKAAS